MIPCGCGTLGRPGPDTEAAALHIGELLGEPARRMILQSSGRAAVFRSLWTCGCLVDFIDSAAPALIYGACTAHAGLSEHLRSRSGVSASTAGELQNCGAAGTG